MVFAGRSANETRGAQPRSVFAPFTRGGVLYRDVGARRCGRLVGSDLATSSPLADEAMKVELGGSSICVPSHTRSAELTKYAAKLRVLGFASFGVGR